MSAQACKNCHYSAPATDFHVACRRYPPSVGLSLGGEHPRPPLVRVADWCGEWRPHGYRVKEAEPETVVERMHRVFWTGKR